MQPHHLNQQPTTHPQPQPRVITLSEVEEHNGGHTSSWTVLYGHVYDITSFINQHPGGNIIQYAAGRDSTCLFESYHSSIQIEKCLLYLKNKCTYLGELYEDIWECHAVDDSDSDKQGVKDGNEVHEYHLSYSDQYAKQTHHGESTSRATQLRKLRAAHNACKYRADDSFFLTVSHRVDTYLRDVHQSDRHAYEWYNKCEAMTTLILYCIATYFTSVHGSYIACGCLGILTGRMGFMMHNGNHCAISSLQQGIWWNRFVGMFMDIVGSSHYIWGFEHQVAHHMTPNEFEKDNDCEIGNPTFKFHPLISDIIPYDTQHGNQHEDDAGIHEHQPMNDTDRIATSIRKQPQANTRSFVCTVESWIRSHQHILVPILMSVGFFKWFMNDIEFFLKGRAGNVRIPVTPSLWVWMLFCKVVWILVHVTIPYHYYGLSYTLLSVFIFMSIGAEYLENTFIVNHIQEECQVPMIALYHQQQQSNQRGYRSLHWATQQVCTTTNWGSGSHLFNFLSGGLNHQIEHHLFPTMSTCMYPLISPIVKRTCEEYHLPYHNYHTFSDAWIDMYHYLKKLGNPELDVSIKKVM